MRSDCDIDCSGPEQLCDDLLVSGVDLLFPVDGERTQWSMTDYTLWICNYL
jgi:hypothetical protein